MATTSTSDMAIERSKTTQFLQSDIVASEPVLIRTADAGLLQGELADVPGVGRCLIVGDTPSFAAGVRLAVMWRQKWLIATVRNVMQMDDGRVVGVRIEST